MVKIIISALLIVVSVFVYAELSRPMLNALKFKESQLKTLNLKIKKYKRQLSVLKTVKLANIVLKKQKVSTYMFTLLSFINYLKNKGLSVSIKLNKTQGAPVIKTQTMPNIHPVKITGGNNTGFKPYEIGTKFAGVKKLRITLTFKGYQRISTILSVMDKMYLLFPIRYTGFKINSKMTVINFNLYSFKGV